MALKLARFACAVIVAASLAGAIGAISEHDAERARWELERATLGDDAYDAIASDRAYDASRGARRRAGWLALLLASSISALLSLASPQRDLPGAEPSTWRRNAASLIDLALLGTLTALAALDDGESALLHALAMSAPVLAMAAHALPLLLLGRSLGMALGGLRAQPSPARAWMASVLLPLVVFGLLRPAWSGPHWRLAGVAPRRDAG